MDKISITDLPRTLREQGTVISYNMAWRAANEGRIPAERHGKRWFVKASDLDTIRATLAPVSN